MKFNQRQFISKLFDQDFFSEKLLTGKRVIIISDMQASLLVADYLKAYLEQLNVAECLLSNLFNPRFKDSYLSVADIRSSIGNELFDFVILLGGLEKERNFIQASLDIQSMCRPQGNILVLARTPLETGTELALEYYEDEWRYEPRDLVELFASCEVERAALSNPEYLMALRFKKKTIEQQGLDDDYALYNCRMRRRATQNDARSIGFFHSYQLLDHMGAFFHTDKCHYDHNYLDKYEFFLESYRQDTFNLLELGVFIGASEYMWQEYFPNAQIYGVDIDPACQKYATERVHIIQADLSQVDELERLKEVKPRIIIDDASHLWSHQILALFTLFDTLPSGGVYIIEDMETSVNQDLFPGFDDAEISAYEVCSRIAKIVESKRPYSDGPYAEQITTIGMRVELISFMKGSCIMIKR